MLKACLLTVLIEGLFFVLLDKCIRHLPEHLLTCLGAPYNQLHLLLLAAASAQSG